MTPGGPEQLPDLTSSQIQYLKGGGHGGTEWGRACTGLARSKRCDMSSMLSDSSGTNSNSSGTKGF